MINTIKSYFIYLGVRLAVLAELERVVKHNPYTYTCLYLANRPDHIKIWYSRELKKYAEKQKVGCAGPFSELARRNNSTPQQERLLFLEQLKQTLS